MADRRRINGEDKFVGDHHKRARLSYAAAAAVDDESHGDPRISLHAVAPGVAPVPDTVRLKVRVHGHDLVALVDSGASHSFLREDIAARLGLRLQPPPAGMRAGVAVPSGGRLACSGVCRGTEVVFVATAAAAAAEPFQMDCYVLELVGYELILGVQWLRTLGPIVLDFTDLTMSCTVHGRRVTWRGEPRPPPNPYEFIPKRPLMMHGHGGDIEARAPWSSISFYSLVLAVSIVMNIILFCRLLISSSQPCK